MNADVEKRDFFKDPFSEVEFKKIIKMTGKKPSELITERVIPITSESDIPLILLKLKL